VEADERQACERAGRRRRRKEKIEAGAHP
jgi:hypothetical protein